MSTGEMRRPGSVTIVVVLTWLQALLLLVGGFALIVVSETTLDEVGLDPELADATGAVEMALGLAVVALAILLGKGSNFSRIVISLIMIVRMGLGVVGMFTLWGTALFWFSGAGALFALLILILLWNRSANLWFAH